MKMSWFEKWIVNSRFFDFWRILTIKRVMKHVRQTSERVLEVGCGKGTTTLQILKHLPKAKIFAIDFDSEQVELARRNINLKQVTITEGDASRLKFKDQSFTAVLAFLTFHHVSNWKRAIRESHRVLKPGGNLYLDELALKPFPTIKHLFCPTPSIFSKKEFFQELEKTGFKVVATGGNYKFWVHAQKSSKL